MSWRETTRWSAGHCVALRVTARAAVATWTIRFEHSGHLTTTWDAQFTPTALGHEVRPHAWNAQLRAGASVGVGYCASPHAIPTALAVE